MSTYERDPNTGNLTLIDGMRSVDDVKALMLDLCYPIGSMYISTVDTSPQTFLGGTWIRHEGYVLRAATSGVTANSAVKDLGSDDAIVVSHSHSINAQSISVSGANHRHQVQDGNVTYSGSGMFVMSTHGSWSSAYTNYSGALSMSGTLAAHDTNSSGSSGTNANIPNEKNVYMWERIA